MFIINVYTAYYNSRVIYEMKSMFVSDYALMSNVVIGFFHHVHNTVGLLITWVKSTAKQIIAIELSSYFKRDYSMFVMIDIWILPFSLIGPSNQLNIDTFILKSKNKKKKKKMEKL